MKKRHLQPFTLATSYTSVSSDWLEDVDLSMSAQLLGLKDYARANGFSVAREFGTDCRNFRHADQPAAKEAAALNEQSQ